MDHLESGLQSVYIAMSATFCLFILCLPSLSSVLASAQLRAAVAGGLSLQVDLRPSVSGLKSMFSISKDFSKHSFVSYIVVYTVLNNKNNNNKRKKQDLFKHFESVTSSSTDDLEGSTEVFPTYSS